MSEPAQQITDYLGYGAPDDTWKSISEFPLIILVGVTGVGKSTTVEALREEGVSFKLLPNRRVLTDDLIISYMQSLEGNAPTPVADREKRFQYTAAYREKFRGGMAHALTRLTVKRESNDPQMLFFDGLRGETEVLYAAKELPLATFIVLDAPNFVRVKRLLGRGDVFDKITSTNAEKSSDSGTFGVYEDMFTPEEISELISLVEKQTVQRDELEQKLKIVHTERQIYDPVKTKEALMQAAPERTLVVDTVKHLPEAIAKQASVFLTEYYTG